MITDRLVANAPLSLRAIKATIVRAMQSGDDGPHPDLDHLIDGARHSADAREGMAARMERRTPRKKFLHPDAGGSRSDLGKPTVKTCAGCIDILNTRTRYYPTGK